MKEDGLGNVILTGHTKGKRNRKTKSHLVNFCEWLSEQRPVAGGSKESKVT